MTIILRKPWTRQPHAPVEPTEEVVAPRFLYISSLGNSNLIDGKLGTAGASDQRVTTPYGIAHRTAAVADAGLNFGTYQPVTTTSWTIIVLANPTSASSPKVAFSQRDGFSPYHQISFNFNADNTFTTSPGRFGLWARDSGSTLFSAHTPTTVVDGKWHVFVATSATGSAVQLWVDGVRADDNAIGTGLTPNSSVQQTRIGNLGYSSATGYAMTEDIALVATYPGKLPDEFLRTLRPQNLHGRLLAPRRIPFPVSTGAMGTAFQYIPRRFPRSRLNQNLPFLPEFGPPRDLVVTPLLRNRMTGEDLTKSAHSWTKPGPGLGKRIGIGPSDSGNVELRTPTFPAFPWTVVWVGDIPLTPSGAFPLLTGQIPGGGSVFNLFLAAKNVGSGMEFSVTTTDSSTGTDDYTVSVIYGTSAVAPGEAIIALAVSSTALTLAVNWRGVIKTVSTSSGGFHAPTLVYLNSNPPSGTYANSPVAYFYSLYPRKFSDAELLTIVNRGMAGLYGPVSENLFVPQNMAAGPISVALTGLGITSSLGSLGSTRDVALTGHSGGSFAQGTLSPLSQITLSGQALTSAQGALVPNFQVALLGILAQFTQGSVGTTGGDGQSAGLSGSSISSSQGSMGVDISIPLTGLSMGFLQGTLSPQTAVALSGLGITSAQGTATPSGGSTATVVTIRAGSWIRFKKIP